MIALAPMLSDLPVSSAAAAGFQKMVEASSHGVPVAAKPRETAQVPTSLSPNPWAEAEAAGMAAAAMAIQAAVRNTDTGGGLIWLHERGRGEPALSGQRGEGSVSGGA